MYGANMLHFITFSEGGRFSPIELPDEWKPKRIVSEIKKKTKTFIILFRDGKEYDAILHSLQNTDKRNYSSGWRHIITYRRSAYANLYSEYHRIRMLCKNIAIEMDLSIVHITKLKLVRMNNKHKGVVRGMIGNQRCAYCERGKCK